MCIKAERWAREIKTVPPLAQIHPNLYLQKICIFGKYFRPMGKKILSFRVQHKPCFWMCRCCVHKTFRGLLFLYGTHFSLEVFEELQPCRRPALNLWHLRGKNCHLVADPLLCFICKNMTLVFHSVWED